MDDMDTRAPASTSDTVTPESPAGAEAATNGHKAIAEEVFRDLAQYVASHYKVSLAEGFPQVTEGGLLHIQFFGEKSRAAALALHNILSHNQHSREAVFPLNLREKVTQAGMVQCSLDINKIGEAEIVKDGKKKIIKQEIALSMLPDLTHTADIILDIEARKAQEAAEGKGAARG